MTTQKDINIRVNVQSRDAERNVDRVRGKFQLLKPSVLKVAAIFGGLAAGAIILGRSLIKTAMDAGVMSGAFFRFGDATFELRKTLGELLIRVLSPMLDVLSTLINFLNKTVSAIQPIIWRNWETILEGIRSSLGPLTSTISGLVGALGLLNIGFGTSSKEGIQFQIVLGQVATGIGKELRASVGRIVDDFVRFATIVNILLPGLEGLIKSFREMIPADLINKIFQAIGGLELFGRVITKLITSLLSPLIGIFSTIGQMFGIMAVGLELLRAVWVRDWGVIKDFFLGVVQTMTETLLNMIFGIWPLIISVLSALFKTQFDAILENLKEWSKQLLEDFGTVAEAIGKFFGDMWEILRTDTLETIEAIGKFFKNGWEIVKNDTIATWNAIRDGVVGIVNDMIKRINKFLTFWNDLEFRTPSISFSAFGRQFRVASRTFGTPNVPLIPRLQTGGTIQRGGMAIVGERGRELVNLPSGATVTPHSGGGSGNFIWNQNGPVFGFLDLEDQVNRIVTKALSTGAFRGLLRTS